MMTWTLVGEGTYNRVYRNDLGKGDLIFKVAKPNIDIVSNKPIKILNTSASHTMDNYARSVRIWNDLNANIGPPAYIEETMILGKMVKGWVCPYVKGVQASDLEIAQKLIEIYNRTGRIIMDAPSPRNFLKTPARKIECVDIGMAVQLEKREEDCLLGLQRRSSFSSLETWHDMVNTYSNYFANPYLQNLTPHTMKTIKALLYIKEHRQDIEQVGFLTTDPEALIALAKAYDIEHPSDNTPIPSPDEINQTMNYVKQVLMREQPLSLEEIKQFCRRKLSPIITSSPTPSTPHSENDQTTQTRYALELLQQVNLCKTIPEIRELCTTIQDLGGMKTSELMEEEKEEERLSKCISECKLALATAKQAVEHKLGHQEILKGPGLV